MHFLPLTLIFSSWYTLAHAGSQKKGGNCTTSDNRLEIGTYQFYSDCDAQTYCSSQGTCELKGCRRDQYPFGYAPDATLPPKCDPGQFCPDEADACQPLLPVGSACQLNRDDQCEPPSNWQQLADTSYGRNFNGSVCLNNVCMWANVTVGLPCVIDNTAYTAYTATGGEFIDIVSRGNCQMGLYCDSQSLVCIQTKQLGETCDGDKECSTLNCHSNGVCGVSADSPRKLGIWVYGLVGVGIFGGMFATLITLYLIHRNQRDMEREKRIQYWNEQNAFRQNILQLKEAARNSILSLPGQYNGNSNGNGNGNGNSNRSTVCSRAGSDESSTPILQHSVHKSSGLRQQYVSSQYEESFDEMMGRVEHR